MVKLQCCAVCSVQFKALTAGHLWKKILDQRKRQSSDVVTEVLSPATMMMIFHHSKHVMMFMVMSNDDDCDQNYDNNWFSPQTGVPHYEDFISKAGKLHGHLK